MQTVIRWAAAATLAMTATAIFAAHHEGPKDQKEVAAGWTKSSCGELAPFISYVEKHMADDGVFMPARYVGFGFQLDNNPEDEMRVVMVTPDTPASKVLQQGDVFVSVNGVPSTFENRDKMTFRGKPGEPVPAVILRDGKEMEIEVNRGVIEAANDKERALMPIAVRWSKLLLRAMSSTCTVSRARRKLKPATSSSKGTSRASSSTKPGRSPSCGDWVKIASFWSSSVTRSAANDHVS